MSSRINLGLFAWQCLAVLSLVCAFYWVRPFLLAWSALDQQAYFSAVFLHRVLTKIPVILLIAIFCLSVHIRFEELRWDRLFGGRKLRNVIVIISLMAAWQFSLYEYNFYFDQWHWFERSLLLMSAIMVFKHPAFCFPVVLLVQIIGYQFNYPLQPLSWTDKRLPFDILILFNCYLVVRAWIKTPRETFVYVALCLVGSFYFVPALSKLSLGESPSFWILENDLANLFVSSYINGWISHVPEETILQIASVLHVWNPILLLITLASETGGLFVLVHKKYTVLWLVSVSLLHVGIFVGSGIWFWKWVCVDLGIALFLISLDKEEASKLYRPSAVLLSLPLIYFSSHYFAPPALGWMDSRFNNFFTMEATAKSGQTYRMNPEVFGPYNLIFAQNRFFYLVHEPILADTFGGVYDESQFRRLQQATVGDISNIRHLYGIRAWDEDAGRRFANFISRYTCLLNKNRGPTKITLLAPPRHIYTIPGKDGIDYKGQFETVRVRFRETLYSGSSIDKVSEAIIMKIRVCSVT